MPLFLVMHIVRLLEASLSTTAMVMCMFNCSSISCSDNLGFRSYAVCTTCMHDALLNGMHMVMLMHVHVQDEATDAGVMYPFVTINNGRCMCSVSKLQQ